MKRAGIPAHAIVESNASRDSASQVARATLGLRELLLRGALRPLVSRHHVAIKDPVAVAELMRAIHGYNGSLVTVIRNNSRIISMLQRTGA